MKEYHNVPYTVYTNFLLRIVLTILMRYMFLYKLMEFTCIHHTKNEMFLIEKQMLDKKPYVGSSLWKKLNKTLKTSTSLNAFKHNIKQHHFNELKRRES